MLVWCFIDSLQKWLPFRRPAGRCACVTWRDKFLFSTAQRSGRPGALAHARIAGDIDVPPLSLGDLDALALATRVKRTTSVDPDFILPRGYSNIEMTVR